MLLRALRPKWWQALLCLIAAVSISVLVAWSCALYAPSRRPSVTTRELIATPMDWPEPSGAPWPIDRARQPETAMFVFEHGGLGFSDASAGGISTQDETMQLAQQESFRAGWPFLALAAWTESTYTPVAGALSLPALGPLEGCFECPGWLPAPQSDPPRCIPYRVLATGFVLDALFYGASLMLLWFGCSWVKIVRRHRRGACLCCGHLLAGARVCPECGASLF